MYCITDSNPGTAIEAEDYDSAPRAELVSIATQPLSCLKRGEGNGMEEAAGAERVLTGDRVG